MRLGFVLWVLVVAASFALTAAAEARGGGKRSVGGHSSYSSGSGSHSTRGYTRGNGTYVAPSHATNPNRTQRDNYSARGNLNPYTGKAGTKLITR